MLPRVTLAAFLNLSGEAAVVVGGGPVALRRARTLLNAGLRVRVVAPELHPDLAALPVGHDPRPYRPGDVAGARVVVAATSSPEVNGAVTAEAQATGALVNHAGDAARGTLRFPAVTRRGGVEVAFTTGRELPLLAQASLGGAAQQAPPGLVELVAARRQPLGQQRSQPVPQRPRLGQQDQAIRRIVVAQAARQLFCPLIVAFRQRHIDGPGPRRLIGRVAGGGGVPLATRETIFADPQQRLGALNHRQHAGQFSL